MKPNPLVISKDPLKFSGLQQMTEKAAAERINEADAMVLTGTYSSDASNFVPGQRTR